MSRWLVILVVVLLGGGIVFGLAALGFRYQAIQKQNIFSQAKRIFQAPASTPTFPPTNTPTPIIVLNLVPTVVLPEGWQIFTSRQYGFDLYYPTDWLVDESQSRPADLIVKIFPQRWQGQQEPWATSATIEVDGRPQAAGEYQQMENRDEVFATDNQIEKVDFAGYPCLLVTSKLPQTGGFGPQTVCLKNGVVYKLQVFAYYKAQDEPATAQKVLDTFRFLQ